MRLSPGGPRPEAPRTKETLAERPAISVVGMGRVGKVFGRPDTPARVTALTRSALPEELSAQFEHSFEGFDITAPVEDLVVKLREIKNTGVRTIINTAGLVAINQDVEKQRDEYDRLRDTPRTNAVDLRDIDAYRLNVLGARNLAEACRLAKIKLIHLSTESVFGTDQAAKYKETDIPDLSRPYFDLDNGRALTAYGYFKRLGEEAVLEANPDALVIRMGGVQGKEKSLFAIIAKQLQGQEVFDKVDDTKMTHLTDVMIRDAILAAEAGVHEKSIKGIYHVSGSEDEPLTPFGITKNMSYRLKERGFEVVEFTPVHQRDFEAQHRGSIPRSLQVVLDTTQFSDTLDALPKTDDAIDQWVDLYVPAPRRGH